MNEELFEVELARKGFRTIERSFEKLISSKYAVIFNKECIKNDLLPKYIYIFIKVNLLVYGDGHG